VADKTEMLKTSRARYTLEFKQEAVRLVGNGQSIAAAARALRVVDHTLFNWIKTHRQGQLKGAGSKSVNAEQMEISRRRAELARVKMVRLMTIGHGSPESPYHLKLPARQNSALLTRLTLRSLNPAYLSAPSDLCFFPSNPLPSQLKFSSLD
jgi:transposase